jgi:tetratricopeptide (TPR) repeat protein
VIDYPKALENLRDAVNLYPKIKEALVELIDVALQMGRIEEAKKWIEVAEKEEIFPARIAFLKGLTLKKEGKNMEAMESFEKAKALDEALSQAADFQIALCYLEERKLQEARERFQASILRLPGTDLAYYARRYQELVEERMFIEKPLRVTLGAYGNYDSNVILSPDDATVRPREITDESSYGLITTARMDYAPSLEGPWLFNATGTFYGNFHDRFSDTHDLISTDIAFAPGYNFGTWALNAVGDYSYSWLRSGSYGRYADDLNLGLLLRAAVGENHLVEIFEAYWRREFFQEPLSPEEDRNGDGLRAYASWIWGYKKGGFFNPRFEYRLMDTQGRNWDNQTFRFSLNVLIPLKDKVALQLYGEATRQDYDNIYSITEDPSFGFGPPRARKDKLYQVSAALNWEFYRHTKLVLQFIAIDNDSNLIFFDYDRQIYLAGVEYTF